MLTGLLMICLARGANATQELPEDSNPQQKQLSLFHKTNKGYELDLVKQPHGQTPNKVYQASRLRDNQEHWRT